MGNGATGGMHFIFWSDFAKFSPKLYTKILENEYSYSRVVN